MALLAHRDFYVSIEFIEKDGVALTPIFPTGRSLVSQSQVTSESLVPQKSCDSKCQAEHVLGDGSVRDRAPRNTGKAAITKTSTSGEVG